MQYHGLDLGDLKEGQIKTLRHNVNGIDSVVCISRKRRSVEFPIGCAAIAVPTEILSDGYWCASLFALPTLIAYPPEPQKLFACIADFLPILTDLGITIMHISLNYFQLDSGKYKLSIFDCSLCYNSTQRDVCRAQKSFAKLLPENKRFQHAFLKVTNLKNMNMHPAMWDTNDDINFLCLLFESWKGKFTKFKIKAQK